MYSVSRRAVTRVTAMLAAISTVACYDAPPTAARSTSPDGAAPRALSAAALLEHPGRTLASNCFQCHGTDGFAGELKIAGESVTEITGHFTKFRASNPRGNIMNVHAQAYTDAEIALIADYFAKQGG